MRKLILFLILALLVTAFAVPAFAASPSELVAPIEFSEFSLDVGLKPGRYSLELFDSMDRLVGTFDLEVSGVDFEQRIPFVCDVTDADLVVVGSDDITRGGIYWRGEEYTFAFEGKLVIIPVSLSEPVSPSTGVLSVFSSIGAYLISGLTSMLALFWTGTSLTFLGVLTVCALAIAVILLLVLLIIRNARGY